MTGRPVTPPHLDPLAIRRLLRDEGLRARHALSQNFLADPDVLEAILVEAAAGPGDRVLEVGPGLGILTGALLDAGAAVTAVELDRRLAELLRKAAAIGVPVVIPRPGLCTDNGAMIGAAGARRFDAGERAGLDLDARPSLPLATR